MNQLYFGDCLDILKSLHAEHPQGFIDLIYIDPPFNSKRNYNVIFEDVELKDTKDQKQAFTDTWSNVSYKDTLEEIKDIDLDLFTLLDSFDKIRISKGAVSYLTTMAIRIWYMHKVLNDTGSFYLHCDPTMSHYLKLVCDLIFDKKNFRNEIIWAYRTGGISKRWFGRKHDIIFFYCKDNINTINILKEKTYIPTLKNRTFAKETLNAKIDDEGCLICGQKGGYFHMGSMRDVWEIRPLFRNNRERLGYPTQKPEELLERIIKASSNKNDLIADFFCGCGTTIAVAQKLNRKYIGVDISPLAIDFIEKRLDKDYFRDATKRLKQARTTTIDMFKPKKQIVSKQMELVA